MKGLKAPKMLSEENRILAVDFGLKRIGLALSDPLLIFSYPYKTINNDQNIWKELAKIIEEMGVNKILLGFPFSEKRSSTSIKSHLLKFKEELEKKFNIIVLLHDESYSSIMAKDHIIKTVAKKSKRREKGLLDMNAAAIILQEYLNDNSKEKK